MTVRPLSIITALTALCLAANALTQDQTQAPPVPAYLYKDDPGYGVKLLKADFEKAFSDAVAKDPADAHRLRVIGNTSREVRSGQLGSGELFTMFPYASSAAEASREWSKLSGIMVRFEYLDGKEKLLGDAYAQYTGRKPGYANFMYHHPAPLLVNIYKVRISSVTPSGEHAQITRDFSP